VAFDNSFIQYKVILKITNMKRRWLCKCKSTNPSFLMIVLIAGITIISSLTFAPFITIQYVLAQPSIIKDPTLKAESIISGLSSPTSMAFLDNNQILVLEKGGQVRLVSNGQLQPQPVLQVSVNTESERGLLGIATMPGGGSQGGSSSGGGKNTTTVFLYYTEADPLRNRVYKYQWNGQSLVNPTLILDLPAEPGPNHDGGKLAIGPDNYLYAIIGDLNHDGQLQNFADGPAPDDTSGIFRINRDDGSPAANNPFAQSGNNLLSKYYAYGIRNSFGIDFDPLTNNLWDTENGPASYDEINLVRPGFNSGWQKIMGPISISGHSEDQLVKFPNSKYADPVFSWKEPVAITDIEFMKSSKLGVNYQNNIFVGDINNGNLYFFKVNKDRTGVELDSNQPTGVADLVVDNNDELSSITFGTGFGGITDIQTGPDGLLYILSYNDGNIYRISSQS
jgi:aldose sugar dehydrogenase